MPGSIEGSPRPALAMPARSSRERVKSLHEQLDALRGQSALADIPPDYLALYRAAAECHLEPLPRLESMECFA